MLKEKAKEAFKEHGQEAFSKVAKKEHHEHGHEGHGHHHEVGFSLRLLKLYPS